MGGCHKRLTGVGPSRFAFSAGPNGISHLRTLAILREETFFAAVGTEFLLQVPATITIMSALPTAGVSVVCYGLCRFIRGSALADL